LSNTLVILLTEILAMRKRNVWLITSHWIFCLAGNQMTFLVYIEYQNFTRIHIEKIILQVLLLFQDSNCLYIANSSWHWGSYGSIWTGRSPTKYYMDRSFCHMTQSDLNYLLYYIFSKIMQVPARSIYENSNRLR
jgi:hypothetical protein